MTIGEDVDHLTTEMIKRIEQDFTYHPPDPTTQAHFERLRVEAKKFAFTIARLCPPSKERDEALMQLSSAVMHANAAIARWPEHE